MYVFDTAPISRLFRNFYRDQFPSLWQRFDDMVDAGTIVGTRESAREIEDWSNEDARNWAANNRDLVFHVPTADEGAFVAQIFAVEHFQQLIEQQKLLQGGKNADPFVIAKAAVEERTVVTTEVFKPNAAKIPNICQHFGVPCVDLQGFMAMEGWVF